MRWIYREVYSETNNLVLNRTNDTPTYRYVKMDWRFLKCSPYGYVREKRIAILLLYTTDIGNVFIFSVFFVRTYRNTQQAVLIETLRLGPY